MTIVTGVSTAEEFIAAINDKGASLTNQSTPEELVEAIDATGGNVSFQSPNEVVVAAVNNTIPYAGVAVSFDFPSDYSLLGKTASELQSGMEVHGDDITGTLKYVTDYTGFSGSTELQSGHYIAFKVNTELTDDIYVELYNGYSGPVKLDNDRDIVIRIADLETQTKITITCGDLIREFNITGLTLEPAENDS